MKKTFILSLVAAILVLCSLLVACGDGSQNSSDPAVPDNTDSNNSEPSRQDTTIPAIYIHTQNAIAIPDTKEEVNCTVDLVSSLAHQNAANLVATVRTRGNGSMYVGKKTGKFPYKLKFDEKVNPFGTGSGKEKDWVLLASVGDHTILRDYTAKYMASLMGNIPYCPGAKLVNVYLNNEYIGVYLLTEQVEAKDNRVDVNDSLKGDVNGFLVELDAYAGRTETENSFLVNENYYAVKSNVFSEAQLQYIKNYIEQVDSAIYAGDKETLEKLVDINSLVDMYLLQEYVKNIDAGFSSFYMCKDVSGKMYFAPPWDFDLGFGNDKRLDNGSYEGLYVGQGRDGLVQNNKWYIELMSQEWFYTLAAERWQEVSNTIIDQVIDHVREQAEIVSPIMEYNYKRWDFMGKFIHQEPDAIVALTTYNEHVDYMIQWMQNRKAWLDSEFQKPFSSRQAIQ